MKNKLVNTCAVCGRRIRYRGICSYCYKKWGNFGDYPKWLSELVKMHLRFEKVQANFEIAFSDDNRDLNGDKVILE